MQTETVVRLRAGARTDRYSKQDVAADWATPAELPLATVAPAAPTTSRESAEQGREAVVSGWTLYLEPGADVTERDRVRVRGLVYKVAGKPADWGAAGVVVVCESVEG